jgi:hypothetical protein
MLLGKIDIRYVAFVFVTKDQTQLNLAIQTIEYLISLEHQKKQ